MTHRFDARDKELLKGQHRIEVQPAQGIIERASPYPDEICADLGCGTGYLTIPLTGYVKAVVALDSQMGMLDALADSASSEQMRKVCMVRADLPELPFADSTLDRVFLINVLHEFDDKDRLVEEVRRVLKDDGRATLVDFQMMETSFGPPVSERIAYDEVERIFQGMTAVESWSFDEFYQFELSKDRSIG